MAIADRFRHFFAAVHGGDAPYPWQCALVEEIASTGNWPDIAVPTGAGKSSVVDVHVFLVAEHKLGGDVKRPPRRLVLVAPRRVLVDDQFDRACELAARLDAAEDPSLGSYADALRGLRTSEEDPDGPAVPPIGAWRLRGGARMEPGWRIEPAACQIVCTTPQMWGSRLLFRGYGSTRRARNLESGLLAHDAVVVVDEAHLHERLVQTARAAARLGGDGNDLQVVSMTATPRALAAAHRVTRIVLSDADNGDDRLMKRVDAIKRIELVETEDPKRRMVPALADAARAADQRETVGVFVNDIPTALGVADALQRDGDTVAVVCGRMRPADVVRLREDYPGLLDSRGNRRIQYLVSTQSLEVGVDLDLCAMVSTIASASALAQRAGRLNRSGRWGETTFTVVAPWDLRGADVADVDRSGPYESSELVAAAQWLHGLNGSIAPSAVTRSELPSLDEEALPALRRGDLQTLELTSDAQSADPDLDLYLDVPRAELPRIGIVARRSLRLDEEEIVTDILQMCPPRAHEIAPTPPPSKRERERLWKAAWETVWLVRAVDGELQVERIPTIERLGELRLLDGDVLVVPNRTAICTRGIVDLDASGRSAEPLDDVLSRNPTGTSRDVIVELVASEMKDVLAIDRTLGSRRARNALLEVLSDGHDRQATMLLRTHRRLSELQLHWSGGSLREGGPEGDEAPKGLLLISDMTGRAAETPRFTADEKVTLDIHEQDVTRRIRKLLDRLGDAVTARERQALLDAAAVHDEGKRHPRFQARMGNGSGDEPVAKALPGHRPDQGDGWRHEQLSAAVAAARFSDDPLVVSLVSAHHGAGRGLFNRGCDELLDGWRDLEPDVLEAVERLFGPRGTYERLRVLARNEVGIYRLAWLEALLRAADMQVSREGR